MTADHSAQFEEVMALLDGELPPEAADRVRGHVVSCTDCQKLAQELRDVSHGVQAWNVGPTPATLQMRRSRPWFKNWKALAAAAVVVLAVGALPVLMDKRLAAPAPSAQTAAAKEESFEEPSGLLRRRRTSHLNDRPSVRSQAPTRRHSTRAGRLIIRNASLSVIVRDFERARGDLDRIATSVGGFIGNLVASGARGAAPSLNATLRVPSTRLADTLSALKALGDVQHESQNSDDVTQRSADLDARLSNARASEVRLKDVLKNRTGRLSDVLDVEREIARVRGEIEQMEAERKHMDGRIAYATVNVELTSERKAEAVTGSLSISTRLRNAIVDGFAAAVEHAISLAVFAAEVLPTLVLWLVILGPPAFLLRRRMTGRV